MAPNIVQRLPQGDDFLGSFSLGSASDHLQ